MLCLDSSLLVRLRVMLTKGRKRPRQHPLGTNWELLGSAGRRTCSYCKYPSVTPSDHEANPVAKRVDNIGQCGEGCCVLKIGFH
jgi:hypothetical protein